MFMSGFRGTEDIRQFLGATYKQILVGSTGKVGRGGEGGILDQYLGIGGQLLV